MKLVWTRGLEQAASQVSQASHLQVTRPASSCQHVNPSKEQNMIPFPYSSCPWLSRFRFFAIGERSMLASSGCRREARGPWSAGHTPEAPTRPCPMGPSMGPASPGRLISFRFHPVVDLFSFWRCLSFASRRIFIFAHFWLLREEGRCRPSLNVSQSGFKSRSW